ncbi:hypothetical protein GCM10009601_44810 [Streptomyces thermospinosisporus]|uniref:Uncharacterized protein n=1 Tax=Streptomyces thermospinosisporus TaxID=161482 RepID=A0ABP4JWD9_9ACTN
MHPEPETHLVLHRLRAAELRARPGTNGPAPVVVRRPSRALVRTRLGWALVELGLRLATTEHRARVRTAVTARAL